MINTQFEIILYVANQERSKSYYSILLGKQPELDVPGMTEFVLNNNLKLGLMPENGIAKILTNKMPHPAEGNGIPRCELYLLSTESETLLGNVVKAGAVQISPFLPRDWGHTVGYFSDPDGHIIAIAKES